MEEMDILLKLQEIDLQLNELKEQHDDIPLQMEELEKDVNGLKMELEKQESELKSLKLSNRESESKVALLEEMIKRYKQQLLSVKTNREYSALLTEIEAAKREKEELEEQIIRNMEQAEAAESRIDETKQELRKLEKLEKEKKNDLAGKMRALEAEINLQMKKRTELAHNVERPVLNLYQRIMNSRLKQAVVPLHNGSCGGCFAVVPLQKVADIRMGGQIYTCDNCGRILYYNESQES